MATPMRITVDVLKEEIGVTDAKLNLRCTEKHLRKIATSVGNFIAFASKFDMPKAVIKGIETSQNLTFVQKVEAVFMWWHDNVRNATYCSFVQVCIELSEGHLARRMCQLCAEDDDTIMSKEDTDALEKLLLDNKIEGFSLTSDKKIYKKVVQHFHELGHVEFAASLRSRLDKEISASRALNEAIKAGNVRVKITNVLLFGMAGTGKTSTKHLLLGLDPPASRNSTPLAKKAEKAQIREASNQKLIGVTWQPITSDGLLDFIADVIKCKEYESKRKVIPKEFVAGLEPRETSQEFAENFYSSSSSESDELTPSALNSDSRAFTETVSHIMKSVQQACELKDDDASAPREKLESNWIYLIDSGGQPHFHNLLPLFIPKISVALYILRLSDRLDHHPEIEYYKDGRPVGKTLTSHLSVLDNYGHLVQSIQSHNIHCKLICIGTHKDRQSESQDENLDDKNTKLRTYLDQTETVKNKTVFYDIKKKDVIFPFNCKEPDKESKKNASKIRQIVNSFQDIEILVPIWWYALEIAINKISADQHRKILSKNECVQIAQSFNNFQKIALVEALEFFHKHHIFHYYPAILPEVVFCDTQVLLDKVTELVEHAAFIRGSSDPVSGLIIWVDFVEKGIITIEILSDNIFQKHYVDKLFTPNELITIFKHLLIATPLPKSSEQEMVFYMPSLLSMIPLPKLCEIRANFLNSSSVPLVLKLKDEWQCCGVFCCLQVYLIQKCHWEIKINDSSPSRNFVQLRHENKPCSITLIDCFSFFEIHFETSSACSKKQESDILSLIYCNIRSGLESAYEVCKYSYKKPEVAFLCPCFTKSFQGSTTDAIKINPNKQGIVSSTYYNIFSGLRYVNAALKYLCKKLQASFFSPYFTELFFQSSNTAIPPHLATILTSGDNYINMRCTQQKDEDVYFEFEEGHKNWNAAINRSQNVFKTEASNQAIGMSHLKMVFKVLNKARNDWYFIGEDIGCTYDDLNEIEDKHLFDQRMCLHKMLQRRIQRGGLTRSMLCNSLRDSGRDDIAEMIEALDLN